MAGGAKKVSGKTAGVPAKVTSAPEGARAAAGRGRAPNGAVGDLVVHAETLASTVRAELPRLATAKVTAADADALEAGAARLRAAEATWVDAHRALMPGTVGHARAALTRGRNLLFGGIGAFVEHAAARRELKRIGVVENDADLDADADRLIALARRFADDLAGTEVTPAAVASMATDLAAFRAARSGAAADAPTRASLASTAAEAGGARNAAYWALLALDKQVCKRGRFRFREDPKRRAAFGAFATERRRGVKKAAATARRTRKAQPKDPAPTP